MLSVRTAVKAQRMISVSAERLEVLRWGGASLVGVSAAAVEAKVVR